MKNFLSLLIIFLPIVAFTQQKLPKDKQDIDNSIEAHKKDLIAISDEIWAKAETAFEEYDSSKILSDYAENNGFTVEKGVAGMPTAFVATYGSGKPVIGILGEFDALPGISQKAVPVKEPLQEGAAGHGCGRDLPVQGEPSPGSRAEHQAGGCHPVRDPGRAHRNARVVERQGDSSPWQTSK